MFTSIQEIMTANRKNGGHFFDRGTLRFFRSRVDPSIFGGRCFVTSEQNIVYYPEYRKEPREYTVRIVSENGDIDTVGEFGQYKTLRQARRAAEREPICNGSH